MERLEAAWGPPKDRTAGQMVAMVREWFGQLERFGVRSVEAAFTHVIGANKFQWVGAIVEIVAFCTKDDSDWRDALGLKDERRHVAEPVTFERDGRTVEEEIEFRAQQIAGMKRDAGMKSHAELLGEENATREIKPASQEMHVSQALLDSKLVRELKAKQRADAERAANQTSRSYTATGDLGEGRDGQS